MRGPAPDNSQQGAVKATGRQRVDWVEFFRRVAKPHGIRIRLASLDAGAPEGLRAEKRLIRIVKMRAGKAHFALRRSFTSGPPIIDCMFTAEAVADELAKELGAVPVRPPLGWASARELVADRQALRRILKMGAEESLPRGKSKPSLSVAMVLGPPDPAALSPSKSPIFPSELEQLKVDDALRRLAEMSPDEQAAALFQAMMGEDSALEQP